MAFRAIFPLRVFVHAGGGSSEFKRLNNNPDGPVGLRRHEMESQAYQRVGLSEPSVFGQTPWKLRVTAQVPITRTLKLK